MKRYTLLVAALLTFFVISCGGKQRGRGQRNYLPVVVASLSSGEAMMTLFSYRYFMEDNWKGCVVARTLSSAFSTASYALSNPDTGIPGISVDVSLCLAINPDFEPGDPDDEVVGTIIELSQSILGTVALIVDQTGSDPEQCRVREVSVAALHYVSESVDDIIEEITAPDGILLLEEVLFDFSSCPDPQ